MSIEFINELTIIGELVKEPEITTTDRYIMGKIELKTFKKTRDGLQEEIHEFALFSNALASVQGLGAGSVIQLQGNLGSREYNGRRYTQARITYCEVLKALNTSHETQEFEPSLDDIPF